MNDCIYHLHLRNSETVAYRAIERDGQWMICFDPLDDDTHSPDLVDRIIPAHQIKYVDQIELTDHVADEFGLLGEPDE